jgi:hypothetical protein
MLFSSFKTQVARQCPKCSYPETVRSQRIDLDDRLLSLINLYPYRCQRHTCKHRFQGFGRN